MHFYWLNRMMIDFSIQRSSKTSCVVWRSWKSTEIFENVWNTHNPQNIYQISYIIKFLFKDLLNSLKEFNECEKVFDLLKDFQKF